MNKSESVRILYMEDDPGLAHLVQKQMTRAGCRVDIAGDGKIGLEMSETGRYDVIAVDQNMPGYSGLDVIKALASRGPLPPVVMITGRGDERTAVEAMKLGAGDYIIKDVDGVYIQTLPGVVERLLERGRLMEDKKRAEEALQKAREELEIRVEEKTAELAEANRALRLEIAQRERTVISDITRRKRAERALRESNQMLQANLKRLESLNAISKISGQNLELDEMIEKIIKGIFKIFDPDRAWLLFPCDPDSPVFRVCYECTRQEHPGAKMEGMDVPMDDGVKEIMRDLLSTDEPATYNRSSRVFKKTDSVRHFSIQSQMVIILKPIIGKPWILGMHQCSHERAWTKDEQLLFKDISIRITDSFSSLLINQNLRKSEKKPRESEERYRILAEKNPHGIQTVITDITEHNRAEQRKNLNAGILDIINQSVDWKESIEEILTDIKEFTDFEAVALRFKEGEDFPYYVTQGFPGYFVEAERYLCARDAKGEIERDSDGNPYVECMCGNILCGRTDPGQYFFTEGGSFWSNNTTKLLAETTDKDRQTRTRNRCNGEGYESVALIPLKDGGEILGLIQLNDKRTNRFNEDLICFFEEIGKSIGIAFARKQAEAALRESERRFRTVADFTYDWEYWIDPDGNHMYVSPSCERITGYRADEFIRNPGLLKSIVHADDRGAFVSHLHDTTKTDGMLSVDFRVVTRDGAERWMSHVCQPVHGPDGRCLGQRASNRDITEKKRAEMEIIELNRSLEEMVYVTSHDLQSPLVSMEGFASELLDNYKKRLDDEGVYCLTRLRANARRMHTLVLSLLDMSRLNTTKYPREAFEAKDAIDHAVRDLELLIQKSKTKIEIGSVPRIYGDRLRMTAVFRNLITNAIIYGGDEITIGCDDKCFHIQDNGVGIPKNQLEKIFSPAERLKMVDVEGVGMGLAFCAKVIRQHGGEIWAESEGMNKGATFYFTLKPEKQRKG